MAQKIRMIGLDLDGTALTNDKRITEETRQAVTKAAEMGVVVVPATGRTLMGIAVELRELPGIVYGIASNGAGVYDLKTGECLWESCMTEAQAVAVLEVARAYPILIDVFAGGTGWLEEGRRGYVYQVGFAGEVLEYILATHGWVPDLMRFVTEDRPNVQKITVNFPGDALACRDEVRAKMEQIPDLLVVCGGGTNLEITSTTANKGAALLQIGRKLGITPEEIMAIGDSENDLAMLQAAGLGIAMANAVDAVKAVADDVTASNEENGVAQVFEKYIFAESAL